MSLLLILSNFLLLYIKNARQNKGNDTIHIATEGREAYKAYFSCSPYQHSTSKSSNK